MGGKEAISVTWNELIKDAPGARVSRTESFTNILHDEEKMAESKRTATM